MSDDKFSNLGKFDQRRYTAQALGCDPDHPGGWPNAIIDRLVQIRTNQGTRAFYEELGHLLAPH